MILKDWQIKHKEIIIDFLTYLNSGTDKFLLKGGTSLMLCYGLTRFSEDIDLDGFDTRFFRIVDSFIACARNKYPGITYRKAKDTDTVKRAFIHYGGAKPLKVEVSYRVSSSSIAQNDYTKINGIMVYTITNIFLMKLNAFNQRDKLRDMYDVLFIYIHYKGYLNSFLLFGLRDAFQIKGVEYFDYIIRTQSDELIDNNELAESFMTVYYDLGLS